MPNRTPAAAAQDPDFTLVPDLRDQLAALRDVQLSYELLEMLIDPVGNPHVDLDAHQMAAMLRSLNKVFSAHVAGARSMLPLAPTPPPCGTTRCASPPRTRRPGKAAPR